MFLLKTRLKELRKQRNITQEQLAEAIGVERSSIGKYEGKQGITPSVDVIKAIADYFNVTTDYLLGRNNVYEQSSYIVNSTSLVAEHNDSYFINAFQRNEFTGLTQNEIDKLAIYAEGLKAGRSTID
jgi:transcriptional regulator with XRE-family HTH domain